MKITEKIIMKAALLIVLSSMQASASNFREIISRNGGGSPIQNQPITVSYDQYQYPGCPVEVFPYLYVGIDGVWTAHLMTGVTYCAWYDASGSARFEYTIPGQPAGTVVEYVVEVVSLSGGSSFRKAGSSLHYNQWNVGYSYYGNDQNFQYTVGELSYSVFQWPPEGNVRPGDDLWVNVDSVPQGVIGDAYVVYSSDGLNWNSTAMNMGSSTLTHDHWYVNLGNFPAGSTVEYVVNLVDEMGYDHWIKGGGENFTAVIQPGEPIQWFGNTYHWPGSSISSSDEVWVNTETFPQGAAQDVFLVYTLDGVNWSEEEMTLNPFFTSTEGADMWHISLGNMSSGTTFRYALKYLATSGDILWDNNDGNDYQGVVE